MTVRVLCIEDEPDLRQDLVEELEFAGCIVASAPDGLAGLQLALQAPFDLILCDILLPGKPGLALLQDLRAREGPNQNTPLVFLTAFDDSELAQQCLDAGAAGHFRKPLDYSKICDLIADHATGCA
jgi:CheY-like chemotaxis protein